MAKYQRRHYQDLANILASEGKYIHNTFDGKKLDKHKKDKAYYMMATLRSVMMRLDDTFRQDNENYDCHKFYDACKLSNKEYL